MQWQTQDLLTLLRQVYPEWETFSHAPFVADEVGYKMAASEALGDCLGKEPFAALLEAEAWEEIVGWVEKIGRKTNLLWNNQPTQGDLSILYAPHLDKATFCPQLFNLLYQDAPVSDRLETYFAYLSEHNLPNKWTFPTYFLFLAQPDQEIFVKPRTSKWFLRFMGQGDLYHSTPNPETYCAIRQLVHDIFNDLAAHQPQHLIDIQSLIWVAAEQSKKRTGGLPPKDQIALDQPPSTYENRLAEDTLKESQPVYTPDSMAEKQPLQQPYTLEECAVATQLDSAELARWIRGIERKGQAVLYGPPGTGKTFLAQKLAQHLVGGGDGLIELIQFHPAYAYEDFVQGLRPLTEEGRVTYHVVPGHFVRFCQRAQAREGRCVLIIDELNRAHLSRVFGELMYLLEYREHAIPLAGGGQFQIPKNVRIIGTMNTADRSIALVDHALRRRFAFIKLAPNYDLLRHFHADSTFPIEKLITLLTQLNAQINDEHYELGVSYFLRDSAEFPDIWQMEIYPYLEEYFFNQTELLHQYRWQAIQAFLQES